MSKTSTKHEEPNVQTIYRFPGRNEAEEIRITTDLYHGRSMVSIRRWYQPKSGEEFLPTKRGITLSVEDLPRLLEGLMALAATLPADIPGEDLESRNDNHNGIDKVASRR
jgi:hypothetical protein